MSVAVAIFGLNSAEAFVNVITPLAEASVLFYWLKFLYGHVKMKLQAMQQ